MIVKKGKRPVSVNDKATIYNNDLNEKYETHKRIILKTENPIIHPKEITGNILQKENFAPIFISQHSRDAYL